MIERATDAILLQRFAEGREESAFAELVERHGPSVQRVCRRFLRCEHDVEDVFQATFLTLALRASDVAWRASVGGWVHDVARRLALNARSEIARRRSRETPVSNLMPGLHFGESGTLPDPTCPLSRFTDEVETREVRLAIDGAVEDLPPKYRDPVVLCYLEGRTNQEAAARLGYPAGSMSRRLQKARGLLRKRLVGRGVTLGILLATAAWLASAPRGPRDEPSPRPPAAPILPDFPRTVSSETTELGELLSALERKEGTGLDRARLRLAVEHADEAADRAPAERRAAFFGLAAEARLAALDWAGEGLGGDSTEVSRLHDTCVRCHVALH